MSDHGWDNTENLLISELKFSIKNDPANPSGYVALGKAFAKMGRYEEALAQYEQALDLSPDYPEALLGYAILKWDNGEREEAKGTFENLLSRKDSEKYTQKIGKGIGRPYKIQQLTFGPNEHAFPNCSPPGDRLALQSKRNGNWEIYIFNLTNDKFTRLTNNPARDECPVFSSDALVAFTSTRNDTIHTRLEEMQRDIYLADLNTGEIKRITDNPNDDWAPYFTPTSDEIVFCSDRRDERDTPEKAKRSNIYQININTKEVLKLTHSVGNDVSGCISPDGFTLYFCSDRSGEYDIYTKRLDMSESNLLFSHSGEDVGVRVSKDGTRLVFFAKANGNYDIFMTDLNTKEIQRLTNDPAVDGNPEFSPDGNRIYFHSNQSGTYQIYTIDLTTPISSAEIRRLLN